MMQHTRPEHRYRAGHNPKIAVFLGMYVTAGMIFVLLLAVLDN